MNEESELASHKRSRVSSKENPYITQDVNHFYSSNNRSPNIRYGAIGVDGQSTDSYPFSVMVAQNNSENYIWDGIVSDTIPRQHNAMFSASLPIENENMNSLQTEQYAPRTVPHNEYLVSTMNDAEDEGGEDLLDHLDSVVDSEDSSHELRWNRMYQLFVSICGKKRTRSSGAPVSHTSVGVSDQLSAWLSTQRQLYRKGKLRADRMNKLQILVDQGKFCWGEQRTMNDEERWEMMYSELLKYAECHGHCNVLERYTTTAADGCREGLKLGRWLDGQRQSKKNGKLRADRDMRLQQLVDKGLLRWNFEGEDDKRWTECYDALLTYCEENGSASAMPQSYETVLPSCGTFRLGRWVSHQWQKKKEGKLRSDREALLQRLVDQGKFKWPETTVIRSKEQRWNLAYDALVQYGHEYGHCNVPRAYECVLKDGYVLKLGLWLHSQRDFFRNNRLKQDRLDRLNRLVERGMLSPFANTVVSAPPPTGPPPTHFELPENALPPGGLHFHVNNMSGGVSLPLDNGPWAVQQPMPHNGGVVTHHGHVIEGSDYWLE